VFLLKLSKNDKPLNVSPSRAIARATEATPQPSSISFIFPQDFAVVFINAASQTVA
jgi:hypothetical protein